MSISLPALLLRAVGSVAAWAFLAGFAAQAQETPVVSLRDLIGAEVRSQGFTLPKPMRVHVYSRGGGPGAHDHFQVGAHFHAYGWILNATTREVVWEQGGGNSERQGVFQVADRYLDLPPGSYEAYFCNHAFGYHLPFSNVSVNIDRRAPEARGRERDQRWLRIFGLDRASRLREWREQAGNYGLEIAVDRAAAGAVQTFQAPLRWRNIVVALPATTDDGHWSQGFQVKKPVSLHVYAEGEGDSHRMHDYGWIQDARTRKRVWEMGGEKAQYAGGARKNRRQVETLALPPGDYVATFVTDGSHSPADWNAAPPCDPLMYGLTLSLPVEGERDRVVLADFQPREKVLAELVRVGNDEDRRAPFNLDRPRHLRVYALGEGDEDELADYGWIEDDKGKRVWTMAYAGSSPAGGAEKNRLVDEVLSLPKGRYVLRYRSDGSHAYGHWNSRAPRDQEHYGITVYAQE